MENADKNNGNISKTRTGMQHSELCKGKKKEKEKTQSKVSDINKKQ